MAEDAHVAVLDVAAVLAEVDGDGVGPGQQGEGGGDGGVRLGRPAGLPHGRDVIDVDAQPDHAGHSVCSRVCGADSGSPGTTRAGSGGAAS